MVQYWRGRFDVVIRYSHIYFRMFTRPVPLPDWHAILDSRIPSPRPDSRVPSSRRMNVIYYSGSGLRPSASLSLLSSQPAQRTCVQYRSTLRVRNPNRSPLKINKILPLTATAMPVPFSIPTAKCKARSLGSELVRGLKKGTSSFNAYLWACLWQP